MDLAGKSFSLVGTGQTLILQETWREEKEEQRGERGAETIEDIAGEERRRREDIGGV